jgi:hypothetical protein
MEPTQLEIENFRRVQISKYAFMYGINVPVANNTTLPALLTIEEDADFLVHSITGSAYGPTDVNGARQSSTATIFPLAGTAAGFADRGLMTKITDTGSGRVLTNGWVPLETILTPGYGLSLDTPYPFKYLIRRNSKIQFDLRNRDTTAAVFHFCSIVLNGTKYTQN